MLQLWRASNEQASNEHIETRSLDFSQRKSPAPLCSEPVLPVGGTNQGHRSSDPRSQAVRTESRWSPAVPANPKGDHMPQVFVSIQSRFMVMRDEQGQTMAEYGVVLAVITLVVVGGLMLLAGSINGALEEVWASCQPDAERRWPIWPCRLGSEPVLSAEERTGPFSMRIWLNDAGAKVVVGAESRSGGASVVPRDGVAIARTGPAIRSKAHDPPCSCRRLARRPARLRRRRLRRRVGVPQEEWAESVCSDSSSGVTRRALRATTCARPSKIGPTMRTPSARPGNGRLTRPRRCC